MRPVAVGTGLVGQPAEDCISRTDRRQLRGSLVDSGGIGSGREDLTHLVDVLAKRRALQPARAIGPARSAAHKLEQHPIGAAPTHKEGVRLAT